jgi:hypothetical protein
MRRNYFLICLGLLLVCGSANAQKNLVTNGGFEDELFGWNNNGARQTPYDLKSGKHSCAIVAANTNNWIGIDQIVKIPRKVQQVEFSAWIKTMNVVKGKNDWDGAIFTVVFLDGLDKEIGEGVNVARTTGDQDWTLSKKTIKMPEKAFSFKILVALGNASGTMIVDDVSAMVVN